MMLRIAVCVALLMVAACKEESPVVRDARRELDRQQASAQAPEPAAPSISMRAYSALQTGHTYEQAKQILGAPGEEISASEVAGIKTVMYAWKNADGSNMNAMFQNGQLVQKAQFGLK
jgi:hypothetical protein